MANMSMCLFEQEKRRGGKESAEPSAVRHKALTLTEEGLLWCPPKGRLLQRSIISMRSWFGGNLFDPFWDKRKLG